VRPGTLGQVLDNLADPLLAFDQNNVTFFQVTFQGCQIIREAESVALERLGEEPGELTDNELAGGMPRVKEKPHCSSLGVPLLLYCTGNGMRQTRRSLLVCHWGSAQPHFCYNACAQRGEQ